MQEKITREMNALHEQSKKSTTGREWLLCYSLILRLAVLALDTVLYERTGANAQTAN